MIGRNSSSWWSVCLSLIVTLLMPILATEMPNILIFHMDDMIRTTSWKDSAAQKFADDFIPNVDTPYIDKIYEEGFRFKYSYTTSPKCSPSRYSLLTGRYASRSGEAIRLTNETTDSYPFPVDGTFVEVDYARLGDSTTASDDFLYNIASFLQSEGYYTCMVGKFHLLPLHLEQSGCNDMDTSSGYENCVSEVENAGFDFVDGLYYANVPTPLDSYSHNPEWLNDRAKQCIDNAINTEEKPFFLYLSQTIAHNPSFEVTMDNFDLRDVPGADLTADPDSSMAARADIWDEVEDGTRASYTDTDERNEAAMLAWADEAVKELYNILDDSNDLDDTVFIFLNDHGQYGKSTLYERGARIQTFVRYPGGGKRNTTGSGLSSTNLIIDDIIVSNVDIGPTLIDFAGLTDNVPSGYEMDGVSWKSKISESTPRDNSNFNHRFIEFYQSRAIASFDPDESTSDWDTTKMWKYIWRATNEYYEHEDYTSTQGDCYQIYELTQNMAGAREQNNKITRGGAVADAVELLAGEMIVHVKDTCPSAGNDCNEPDAWLPPHPPQYTCRTSFPSAMPTPAPV